MRAWSLLGALVLMAGCDCGGKVMRQMGSLRADPELVDFGVAIPGQPIERVLKLENRGDAPVLISSMRLADSSAGFDIVTLVPRVEIGATVEVTLRFTGRPSDGASSTRLLLATDVESLPTFEVALTARTLATMPDAGADAGVVDAGVVDAGVMDAGVMDAGLVDAGLADAGLVDAGSMDAGVMDAGAMAGVMDAGPIDAGLPDAGPVDAGAAWVHVASGYGQACGLRSDGRAMCWGFNDEGQTGVDSGTATFFATPTEVPLTDVAEFALGGGFSCARLTNGGVRCWGDNTVGQLGDGTQNPSLTPVVVQGLTDAVSLSAGWSYVCALRANGSVWCWGNNFAGQLGRGSTSSTPSLTPGAVLSITNATHVATGDSHACASLDGGALTCWGANGSYQTGQTTSTYRPTPTVVSTLSNVVDVSAGFGTTCARKSDGTVWCFGAMGRGRLGSGDMSSFGQTATPQQVSGLPDAVEVRVGHEHSCARRSGGSVVCWGGNDVGQLGTGDNVTGFVATPTLRLTDTRALAIGSTADFSCALRANGDAECWGFNWGGQLGGGFAGRVAEPALVNVNNATALAAGADSACAVSNGEVWCWGDNDFGQLGDGTRTARFGPVKVLGVSSATSVVVRDTFACAVLSDRSVRCWGDNSLGQLGDGTAMPRSGPVTVTVVAQADELALGSNFACARTGGTVKCWGGNQNGQLGDGSQMSRPSGVTVPGLTDAVSVAIGHSHTCIARATGAVWCWGYDAEGQVGDSGTMPRLTPWVVPFISTAVSVANGIHFTCARLSNNEVKCWGDGSNGQLGDGTGMRRATAVSWGSATDLTQLWAGGYHTCAKRQGGEVLCSGRNSDGDLGIGSFTPPLLLSPMPAFAGAGQVAPGELHVCALTSGVVRCAGRNRFGSVGDGRDSRVPAPVLRP